MMNITDFYQFFKWNNLQNQDTPFLLHGLCILDKGLRTENPISVVLGSTRLHRPTLPLPLDIVILLRCQYIGSVSDFSIVFTQHNRKHWQAS